MAFSAGTIWENWSTGSTANGGGFNPASANFATDLTTDSNTGNTSSPVVSSGSYTFLPRDVGYHLFVQGGTNWIPAWYIISAVSGGKATLTASINTAVLYGTSITGLNYRRPNGLNTAAGCATVGTPTGGVWSIDYSQNATAGIAYTDLANASGFLVTSAANPFGPHTTGNVINITSGNGFTAGRYEVVSVSGTTATFDRAPSNPGTAGVGNLGGAIGSSSALTVFTISPVAGNKIFVRATGTYTLTSTTTLTASVKGDITNGRINVEGYTTYRGQQDGRPLITSATNSVAIFTLNDNDYWEWNHLRLTHTAATRGNGFAFVTSVSSPVWIKDCIIDGCLAAITGTSTTSGLYLENCKIMNCTSTTAAIITTGGVYLAGCNIKNNAGDATRSTNGNATTVTAYNCIFDANVHGIDSVTSSTNCDIRCHNCTFVNNIGDGIKTVSTSGTTTYELTNCLFWGNNYGIENLDNQAETDALVRIFRNCAFGGNTSGDYSGIRGGRGEILLTDDPFTNLATGDFSLNNAAGGGALLQAAGFPTIFPDNTTVNSLDVGVPQSKSGKKLIGAGGLCG